MPPNLEEAVQRTRAIAESVVRADAERVDREGVWPEAGLRALQAEGLGGLVVPRASGGSGLGLLAVARVCEELGRHCASTAICFGMHHVASAVIAAKASRHHRTRYLEPIAAGVHLTTLSLSEPGTGSHFYIPECRASEGPGGSLVLRGTKSFVTNGGHADSYVVSVAGVEADALPGQFSCVVVSADAAGLRWGPRWVGLGMRGNSSRTLELEGVKVPRPDLLGEAGDQIWYVFQVVAPFFLVAMAGTYLGIAASALDEARAHLVARAHAHTGTRLAEQPIVQHRLGALWAQVARTRALVHHAAALGEAGHEDALPALCSAKAEVAECVVDVVNDVMSLLGGRGYAEYSRIERLMRDARASHVMAPTTDLLRMWTGRALLDVPILAG